MGFAFKFDFLSPEENRRLLEAVEFFVGLELERLRRDNDALQKRCAELERRRGGCEASSELREYKDFVRRLIRTMETAPESAKKRPMLKPEAVGDVGGPA